MTSVFLYLLCFLLVNELALGNSVSGIRNLCFQAYEEAAETPEERDARIKGWMREIIAHQNLLRTKKGLSVFTEDDYGRSLNRKVPKKVNDRNRLRIVDGKVVIHSILGERVILVPRVDDKHNLNYVYQFDGAKLKQAVRTSEFFISQMDDTVTLNRQLSYAEKELWKNGDLNALLSHPKAVGWGYSQPRTHLSVDGYFYSFGPSIRFLVPKEVLLEWAKTEMLTIGVERWQDSKPAGIEIVVLAPVWPELRKYLN